MRSILICGTVGILAGITVNQLACLLTSYALNLGYYAPCMAWLNEYVGGELNAAAIQMLCAALLGMTVGIVIGLLCHRR